jgi:multidrug efflux pump subunit AcrA (membrane-fusion protein)
MPSNRRKFVRRGLLLAGVAVIAAGGTVAYAVSSSGTDNRYVTAAVTRGNLEQRLSLTGSVQQADQETLHFPVAGKVASVSVAVGDTVSSGQQLAALDPTSLQSAVLAAQATLANAKAALENDETAAATSATAATTTSTTPATTTTSTTPATTTSGTSSASSTDNGVASPNSGSGSNTSGGSGSGTGGSGAKAKGGSASGGSLSAIQRQLHAAQQAAVQDGRQVTSAMATAQATCALVMSASPTTSSTPTASASETASATAPATASASITPSATATPSAAPTAPDGSGDLTACLSDLQRVQKAQQSLSKNQESVTRLAAQYADALDRMAKSNTGSSSQGATKSAGSDAAAKSSSGGSSVSDSTSTNTNRSVANAAASAASAAGLSTSRNSSSGASGQSGQSAASKLITDQAAVASAQVALDDANAALAGAVLRAPSDGTVASIGLRAGGSATSSTTITIVRTGAANVTVDVPLAGIRKVAVGQRVVVTPDGSTTPLAGTVTSIGLLPITSTNSSTVSYPVVIAVAKAGAALATGSRAQASIVIGTVSGVLTVTNSALTMTGTNTATVSVLINGVATRTVVRTGAVGAVVTEVKTGLSAGQQVVLADRKQSLPTNSSTTTGRFGPGGFAPAGRSGFSGGGGAIVRVPGN